MGINAIQGNTARQPDNLINIERKTGNHRGDPCDMLGGKPPAEKGDNVPGLALLCHPMGITRLTDRLKPDLHPQPMELKKHFLQHRSGVIGFCDIRQDTQRERVVNHRLTNIENGTTVLGENPRNGIGNTRLVVARDID